jgi:hypothetical protein
MPYLIAFVAFLMLGSSVGSPLQAPPPVDLTGQWILDPEVKGRPSPFCGRECEIKQDAKTLTVTSPSSPPATYQVDGKPVKTTSLVGQYKVDVTVTARWDGARLLITRKTGDLPASELVVSIDNGKLLVEPTSIPGSPFAAPVRATYSKKAKGAAAK